MAWAQGQVSGPLEIFPYRRFGVSRHREQGAIVSCELSPAPMKVIRQDIDEIQESARAAGGGMETGLPRFSSQIALGLMSRLAVRWPLELLPPFGLGCLPICAIHLRCVTAEKCWLG